MSRRSNKSTAKRFRALVITVILAIVANIAISYASNITSGPATSSVRSHAGISTTADPPKPHAGISTTADPPKPHAGISTTADPPKPMAGISTTADPPKPMAGISTTSDPPKPL